MNGWRSAWARAQITGVAFSTLVWVVVWGLSVLALALVLAFGVVAVAGRNTRAMLWWRYGAVLVNDFRREAILAAIVPVVSLRGRHQPAIWLGRRLAGVQAVMPSRTDMVVSPEYVRQVVDGHLANRRASAVISRALGRHDVQGSTLVNAVDAYCLPWRFVQMIASAVSQVATRNPVLGVSWKIRWIVFGAAAVEALGDARWEALIGVVVIAVLSWSTGHFQNAWVRKLQNMGDQRAISDSPGPDLSDLLWRREGVRN